MRSPVFSILKFALHPALFPEIVARRNAVGFSKGAEEGGVFGEAELHCGLGDARAGLQPLGSGGEALLLNVAVDGVALASLKRRMK